MSFADLLSALAMGVLEGLTEFLPISSTGHLILLGSLIGFKGPPGKVFEVSIQLGAILAVIWLYRDLLLNLLRGMWRPGRGTLLRHQHPARLPARRWCSARPCTRRSPRCCSIPGWSPAP